MRRPAAQEKTLDRIAAWRGDLPGPHLPLELHRRLSGRDRGGIFELLLDWLEEAEIDRAGCFKYEPVSGAPANDLGSPVPDEVKEDRHRQFMRAQQKISERKLKRKVGNREPVIIDKLENGFAVGRTRGDAPEIDGSVHVSARRPLRVGEVVTVKIERADAYDLHGTAAGF